MSDIDGLKLLDWTRCISCLWPVLLPDDARSAEFNQLVDGYTAEPYGRVRSAAAPTVARRPCPRTGDHTTSWRFGLATRAAWRCEPTGGRIRCGGVVLRCSARCTTRQYVCRCR